MLCRKPVLPASRRLEPSGSTLELRRSQPVRRYDLPSARCLTTPTATAIPSWMTRLSSFPRTAMSSLRSWSASRLGLEDVAACDGNFDEEMPERDRCHGRAAKPKNRRNKEAVCFILHLLRSSPLSIPVPTLRDKIRFVRPGEHNRGTYHPKSSERDCLGFHLQEMQFKRRDRRRQVVWRVPAAPHAAVADTGQQAHS